MKRFAIAVMLTVGSVIVTAPAHAELATGAKIALHVQAFSSSKVCTKSAPLGACDTYTDSAPAGTSAAPLQYSVYFVAVMDTVANPTTYGGFKGCGFGIQYEPFVDNAGTKSGLLLNSWTLCADLSFPATTWPETNSGMVATWTNCQTGLSIANSTQALVGAIGVTSYSAGNLFLIRRPANDRIEMVGCPPTPGANPVNFDISDKQVGFITFALDSEQGCNPCSDAECIGVAVEPTTWGRLKHTFNGE